MWKSSHKAPWVTRLEHVCLIHMTVAEKNPGLCRSKYSSGRLGRAHPSWTLQVCTCLSKCGWSANGFYHRTVLAQANCQTKDAAPPWNFLPLQALPLLPLAFGLRPGLLHSIPPCLTFTKKGNGIFPLNWPDLTSNSVQLTRFFVWRLDSLTAASTCKLPTPCCHCHVMILLPKSSGKFWCRRWASENPKKGMCRWSKARHS